MSVLSMTDIPLKELRNFVDKLYDGPRRSEDLKIVRDIVQGYISTGKWIRWKCNSRIAAGAASTSPRRICSPASRHASRRTGQGPAGTSSATRGTGSCPS